jgi:hypothetical protein
MGVAGSGGLRVEDPVKMLKKLGEGDVGGGVRGDVELGFARDGMSLEDGVRLIDGVE